MFKNVIQRFIHTSAMIHVNKLFCMRQCAKMTHSIHLFKNVHFYGGNLLIDEYSGIRVLKKDPLVVVLDPLEKKEHALGKLQETVVAIKRFTQPICTSCKNVLKPDQQIGCNKCGAEVTITITRVLFQIQFSHGYECEISQEDLNDVLKKDTGKLLSTQDLKNIEKTLIGKTTSLNCIVLECSDEKCLVRSI